MLRTLFAGGGTPSRLLSPTHISWATPEPSSSIGELRCNTALAIPAVMGLLPAIERLLRSGIASIVDREQKNPYISPATSRGPDRRGCLPDHESTLLQFL